MDSMKRFLAMLFTIVAVSVSGLSQVVSSDVITTVGDDYNNQYASMQVSIGESITETISQNGITLTQGFLQTEIIVKPTVIDELQLAIVNVYPNPVEHSVKIDFGGNPYENYMYEFFDNRGQKLIQGKVSEKITEIPLIQFVSGVYMLRIYSAKSNVNQSFIMEKK